VIRGASAQGDAFDALADPTRRQLLLLLRSDERSVSELASHFESTMAAVSQHLTVLRRTGLVAKRRSGRLQLYRLRPQGLGQVLDFLKHFDEFWDAKLAALGRYLDEEPQ
jgi:DNA-binding transcriptional ArsR family regulator